MPDDRPILLKSRRAGERVKESVTRFLTRKLKLVVKTNNTEFLGFTFRGPKLRWSDQAFEDFRHNLRKLTGHSWMGYFGISDYYRPVPRTGSLAAIPSAHVLVEAVAIRADQTQAVAESEDEQALLAPAVDAGESDLND